MILVLGGMFLFMGGRKGGLVCALRKLGREMVSMDFYSGCFVVGSALTVVGAEPAARNPEAARSADSQAENDGGKPKKALFNRPEWAQDVNASATGSDIFSKAKDP